MRSQWRYPALVALLTATSVANAQFNRRALDSTFARITAGAPAPAVGMIVVHRGTVVYTNVSGFSDLERRVRATTATRFDLASIAKQFTAFAVSRLVEDDRLSPTDDVRTSIPELDLAGARITIANLLHHTAGLEDTDGLYALAGGRNGDPVTHDDLVRLLTRQQHLRFPPGSMHAYSNGGYTLLAEVVARRTGVPFVAYTDTAVFRAVGMMRSGFLATPHQLVPDRALPYVTDIETGAFRLSTSDLYPAAGGLFATLPDMAVWMRHLLQPARLQAATARLRLTGRLSSGDSIGYAWGLGWGRYRGHATLGHSGSGPATSSHLLLIPGLEFGALVTVSGEMDVNPATLAFRAADAALGNALAAVEATPAGPRMIMLSEASLNEEPAESRGVRVDPATMADAPGVYRMSDSSIIVVRLRENRLELAFGGRDPGFPLFPLADGRLVTVPLWDAWRFERSATDGARRLYRERTHRSMRGATSPPLTGVRQPDRTFTTESAARFAGLYYSDELGTAYEVTLVDGALALVHARHGQMRLTALGDHQFAVQTRAIVGVTFAALGDRIVGLELEARSWGARAAFRRVSSPP